MWGHTCVIISLDRMSESVPFFLTALTITDVSAESPLITAHEWKRNACSTEELFNKQQTMSLHSVHIILKHTTTPLIRLQQQWWPDLHLHTGENQRCFLLTVSKHPSNRNQNLRNKDLFSHNISWIKLIFQIVFSSFLSFSCSTHTSKAIQAYA